MTEKMKQILIFLVFVGVVGLIVNYFLEENKYRRLTDEEFLITIGSWESKDSKNTVWKFEAGNTGTMTYNGATYYEWTWKLTEDKLTTVTTINDPITDIYSITFDKENISFTVIDANNNSHTFVKQGTENKPEELLGIWEDQDNCWVLSKKGLSGSGYCDPGEKKAYLDKVVFEEWNIHNNNELETINKHKIKTVYQYTLEGNTLKIYKANKLKYTLTKVEDTYNVYG